MDVALLTMDDNSPQPTSSSTSTVRPHSTSPMLPDSNEILRMLTDPNSQIYAGLDTSPKAQLERILAAGGFDESSISSSNGFPFDPSQLGFPDISSFATLRNSSKTLKCPKCNWHYKYQETLEIHMKEKHNDADVKCIFCADNRQHPKLARGETYSCGYKPYRCDLCRYSTTTKGNLSIHMQSDKHLHAVQELPANIANFAACAAPMSRTSPIDDSSAFDSPLICLICGVFATESLAEMIEHVEKDRSRPTQGDVSIVNGCFRCHLCPYNTTLKANFQLHTRTDKHLQKVQTANHLREGARPHTAIYRLSNTKTSVQVLCRQCQEIISSTDLLREHCHVSSNQLQQQKIVRKFWRCKICSVELDSELLASGHMTCHEPTTWPENIDFKMVEDAAYACAGCGFTTKNIADLEDHAKSHEEGESSTSSSTSFAASAQQQNNKAKKTCPLCIELTDDLEKHLIDEHRIAESAIEKLLLVEQKPEFSHRCTKCKMAFRTEAQLKAHSIQHVFSSYHKCPTCSESFEDHNLLLTHMMDHNKEECEMCSETFGSKEQFISHLNSTKHLQQAKKHLENSLVDLSSQISNDDERFRCNVCNQSYPQANNLEIHMRSVSHQTRMSRLSDLISTGEIDSDKAIVEQPGMPSPTIAQYIEQTTKQQTVNDVMSLLMKSETDENNADEPISGIHVLTQIKVYGEPKITNLVAGLEEKIDLIAGFDETKAAEISIIDCSTCGQQISGILALNLHYEEAHSSSIPTEVLKKFGEKLLTGIEEEQDLEKNGSGTPQSVESNDDETTTEKRNKIDSNMSAASQFAMFSQMMNYLPFMQPGIPPEMISQLMNPNAAAAAVAAAAANSNSNNSPAKRARTRITDEQLKVLRQYFNINNSPTESQIKEMSMKSGLPEKVIKHWFRNTLFKERQRDKDSPYNFNIPPQMGIDLDMYEKTGEAKVVSLSMSSGEKSEINSARATPTSILNPSTSATTPEEKKPTPVPTPALDPTKLNIHTMLSQLQQTNSFPFLDASFMAAAAAGPMAQIAAQQQQQQQQNQQACNTSSSGRRANRTRFTDFQLRTLQQFFDKQAYPKDDDLEALSKKLQLSPRVIVVWFQNARQKARKIYENQPNHENSDRFVRTPGSNFQCKRCNQVFQRYYELIQHQQKKCYKDDGAALMNDNKSMEESLSDEEKAQLLAQQQNPLANFDIQKMQPNDLLKLLGANQKSSNDVLLKMCESMGGTSTPSTSFHKICPMCAQTFREKSAIIEHLQQKHSLIAPIDVDLLPDADIIADSSMALDLSGSSVDFRESISTSPTRSDDDIVTEQLDDSQFATFGIQIPNSSGCRSPTNNKRYRTHLTPLQVQLMKNIFGDYKTPSMAECEMLGKEIGLHKRVVQVWFQNARAKERKSKGNGEEEIKSLETKCQLCDKQFATRLSLQDHLFSSEHIGLLRTNLKKEGVSDVATDNGQPVEKKSKTSAAMDMSSFPFNLMLGAGFPMVDVNLFGTPIPMLQIPEDVKTQIATDISDSKDATVFSQDGQTIETLTQLLPEDEKCNVEAVPKDVGWACTSCTNVFQEEKKLKEHQKTMCTTCDKMLTLTQIHYSCKLCSSLFCLQNDYIMHLHSLPHIQFKP
ncbi:unnamed protein product [Caenorhabditis angaria]|uniref:Uncharacterized protein n=1 Tax=Caenorhabditis angaria TaxID=860376 RepID=A0A9P1I7H7_9PELO|nr:unnamed protein product [Caenorhabditis angaria]